MKSFAGVCCGCTATRMALRSVRSRRGKAMTGFSAILRKDLRLELRSGESTIALVALSLLILVVLVFALDPIGGVRDASTAAGALWAALIFAGMIRPTPPLLAERDNGCIRAVMRRPPEPGAVSTAKMVAAFIFMAVAEVA